MWLCCCLKPPGVWKLTNNVSHRSFPTEHNITRDIIFYSQKDMKIESSRHMCINQENHHPLATAVYIHLVQEKFLLFLKIIENPRNISDFHKKKRNMITQEVPSTINKLLDWMIVLLVHCNCHSEQHYRLSMILSACHYRYSIKRFSCPTLHMCIAAPILTEHCQIIYGLGIGRTSSLQCC